MINKLTIFLTAIYLYFCVVSIFRVYQFSIFGNNPDWYQVMFTGPDRPLFDWWWLLPLVCFPIAWGLSYTSTKTQIIIYGLLGAFTALMIFG